MAWWGYIHTNGSLQVKMFFDRRDLYEAKQSPFVKTVHGPWEVNSREEALDMLKRENDLIK